MVMLRNTVTNLGHAPTYFEPEEFWGYIWSMRKVLSMKKRWSNIDYQIGNLLESDERFEIWRPGSIPFFLSEGVSDRMIEKEIDIDKLHGAINATDEEVSRCLDSLLEDYDIEPTLENRKVASHLIRSWLKEQASEKGLTLKDDELSKLFRLAVQLAYEALYVGSA